MARRATPSLFSAVWTVFWGCAGAAERAFPFKQTQVARGRCRDSRARGARFSGPETTPLDFVFTVCDAANEVSRPSHLRGRNRPSKDKR